MTLRAAVLIALLLPLTSLAAFAQSRTVSGVVKDSDGEPLPGAAIMITGTTKGTSA